MITALDGGLMLNESEIPPGHSAELTVGTLIQVGTHKLEWWLESGAAGIEIEGFQSGSRTYIGDRTINEDRAAESPTVLVLADGVGGRNGGRVAAVTAVSAVQKVSQLAPRGSLDRWLAEVRQSLQRAAENEPGLIDMATTLEVVRLRRTDSGDWQLEGRHVGDSAVTMLDGTTWLQMTAPHTARQDILSGGQVPDERLAGINSLTRSMSPRSDAVADGWSIAAHPGQRVVVCSDGVKDVLLDQLESLIRETRSIRPSLAAAVVIDAALTAAQRGSKKSDNLTVIVADVDAKSTVN